MLRSIPLLLLAVLSTACGPVAVEEGGPAAASSTSRELREPHSDINRPPAFCGDGWCDYDEAPWTCPQDCGGGGGGFCGDGLCDSWSEDSWVCPQDCGTPSTCGDGVCNNGETTSSCQVDCGSNPGTVLGRFSRWCGKVNNHTSSTGSWLPDSDCTSGCNIGGLAYCQKFWPNSTIIRQVSVTPKANNVWTNAGCGPVTHDYDGDDEFECVDGTLWCGDGVCNGGETSSSCPADCTTVLGRFSTWCGKVNINKSPTGSWLPDSDCTSGCNIGGLSYCQKFWPTSTGIRQVPVSAKANNVWTNAGCGPVIHDYDGDSEFECIR